MLDFKFIKENRDSIKQNIANRNMKVDVDAVINLIDQRNEQLHTVEALRQKRNENAQKMKAKLSPEERNALIEEGKQIKESIASLEKQLEETLKKLTAEASRIPNMAHPDAPVGKLDTDNLEIKRVGEIPSFSFKPRDHVELGQLLDIVDFDTAAKVTGPKFYYLKNEGAFLEIALVRYAMDRVKEKGFTVTITPDIAKEEILEGIGFNPRGEESNIYALEGTGTCLVGTAEITLGGYYADQIIPKERLPIRMAGVSHCFRREAGAAGQFSKGLYRVHQFTKVEMFIYCLPSDSERMHEELLATEEAIFQGLSIPYRVVDTCTGDLGAPAYRKFDIEAWMPGRGENGEYGEVTSTSNCTDYQSRRLNIRFKDEKGNPFVHMLNGTAIAVSRAIIAIMENFQNEDGSVRIPARLIPYTGFDVIRPKTPR